VCALPKKPQSGFVPDEAAQRHRTHHSADHLMAPFVSVTVVVWHDGWRLTAVQTGAVKAQQLVGGLAGHGVDAFPECLVVVVRAVGLVQDDGVQGRERGCGGEGGIGGGDRAGGGLGVRASGGGAAPGEEARGVGSMAGMAVVSWVVRTMAGEWAVAQLLPPVAGS
jgi:hypothetical protein